MLTYKDYSNSNLISVDIETKDTFLLTKGTGVYRKDGYVIGVALSDGELSEYYPLRHFDTSSEEQTKNRAFIKDQLLAPNSKVFANCQYDLDWLVNGEGLQVNGKIEDIQIAEPLLDEYKKSYSLDSLAEFYLNKRKLVDGPKEYALSKGWKLNSKGTATHLLWQMPQAVVAEYGSTDPLLTIEVFLKQQEKLKEQFLTELYDLEMSVFPLYLQMKKVGVRIDESKLIKTGLALSDVRHNIQNYLNDIAGFEINVNSNRHLENLYDKLGLEIFYKEPTDKMVLAGKFRGNASFDKFALQKTNNEVAKKVLELRHITTLLSLYINQYPEMLVNGRLHCQFNPLKSDDYGTVSGRLSSSQPNLQQVSSKEEDETAYSDSEILNGLIIRKLFIPEEDHDWVKLDWSQIEYRLLAHYAQGKGSDEIRASYQTNPKTDYHEEVSQLVGPSLGGRKKAKTFNFASVYGMGVPTMAERYGWSLDEAKVLYTLYHKQVPFIKETMTLVGNKAKKVGYIRTILNRRARMPSSSNKSYVMLNRLLQGGSADLMKKAMSESYKAGLYNTLVPHLTVHDELDVSAPRTKEGVEAVKELKHIMENCLTLRVPIIAECEYGKSWGELKKWDL